VAFSPEQVLRAYFLQEFATDLPSGDHAGKDTPGDWSGRLPFLQIRNAGGDRAFNLHRPRMLFTSWATNDGTAEDLLQRIDDHLQYKLPTTFNGIVIALAGTTSSPAWQPYDNPDVARYGATYRFSMHETR
jgi:hypothetical protein